PKANQRVLLLAVGDHLDRSEAVLVELINSQASSADAAREGARAEELLAANRLYRLSAAASGERTLTEVLDELERVLLEVSHAAASASPEELAKLRRRSEEGVLFKIPALEPRVRGPGAEIPPRHRRKTTCSGRPSWCSRSPCSARWRRRASRRPFSTQPPATPTNPERTAPTRRGRRLWTTATGNARPPPSWKSSRPTAPARTGPSTGSPTRSTSKGARPTRSPSWAASRANTRRAPGSRTPEPWSSRSGRGGAGQRSPKRRPTRT